jgi:hypothetical protein
MTFRFESFADALSAQAALQAAYPVGSPVEPALEALIGMGAQCKRVGASRVSCRYVESPQALAGWCWHVALEGSANGIERVRIALATTGV